MSEFYYFCAEVLKSSVLYLVHEVYHEAHEADDYDDVIIRLVPSVLAALLDDAGLGKEVRCDENWRNWAGLWGPAGDSSVGKVLAWRAAVLNLIPCTPYGSLEPARSDC